LLWVTCALGLVLGPLPGVALAEDGAAAGAEGSIAEPDTYRIDGYRSPVPKTLKGARVISAEEAEPLWRDKSAVFIDVYPRAPKPDNLPAGTVWRDPTHMSMDGAHWLPNVGYGVLSPAFEDYFRTRLAALSGGDPSKPLVFFCQKNCWMSWNAAKRALEWGYKSVIWFSEGTDAWQEAGFDLKRVEPVP
jgi:PQQ-dependent catabolism-associated CXXCW motif protein